MSRIAVILFNLGGPDSKESIKPFLFNFFMDWNIVRLPLPFRYLLALYISRTRSKREAGTSYGELGNVSPLLENSKAQASALEKTLGPDFKTFVSMRYWYPQAQDVAKEVQSWNPDKIILLPLYPQFSTTTTRSSFKSWRRAMRKIRFQKSTSGVCCYSLNEGFIRASVDNIRAAFDSAPVNTRLLFSAHGLPESIIKDGDPYQWQCEKSAKIIAENLNIPDLDWSVCYQSRVGKQRWIGPSTEEELRRAARDSKNVIIYPHAFTQEHVETLVEIEIEYRELAHELGIQYFGRVSCVGTHPAFIEGLANLVKEQLDESDISGEGKKRLCPANFRRCCMGSAHG